MYDQVPRLCVLSAETAESCGGCRGAGDNCQVIARADFSVSTVCITGSTILLIVPPISHCSSMMIGRRTLLREIPKSLSLGRMWASIRMLSEGGDGEGRDGQRYRSQQLIQGAGARAVVRDDTRRHAWAGGSVDLVSSRDG